MTQCYQQGCVDVIQLDDRLTVDEVEAVRLLLAGPIQQGLPQVVIDLRRVRFIDSLGLELLLETHAGCQRRGGTLRLAGANALVRDVLRVTGLDQALQLDADVVAAAGAFSL